MTRAERIEKALRAYQAANRIHNDSEAELHEQAEAALSAPSSAPGPQIIEVPPEAIAAMQASKAVQRLVFIPAKNPEAEYRRGWDAGQESMREACIKAMPGMSEGRDDTGLAGILRAIRPWLPAAGSADTRTEGAKP